MHRKILNSAPSSREMNSKSPFVPQFVRPAMNLALARARFGATSADPLWTPNLVDSLRAPLTRYRD